MFKRLLSGSTRRLVAANTLSQLLGKLLTSATTFIVTVVVARQFGASIYGDFVKITTYVALFFLIADFGLNAVYLRKHQVKDLWGALVGLRLGGSLVLIFLSLAILAFLPQGLGQGYTPLVRLGIILFSPAILFQALITTANAVFQRQLRYDLATVAIAAGSAATLGVLWLLSSRVIFNGALVGTLGLLAGSAVTAAVSFWLVSRLALVSITFGVKQTLSLLLPAIPLGVTLVFNLVYSRADSIILTLVRPTTEVGVYGLAYSVFSVPLVLPTFFMNAVYPLMLKATNDKLIKLFKKSFLFLLSTSLFSLLGFWLAAPLLPIIKEDFVASVPALRVLSLSFPFFFVSALTMWTLIALGKQGWLMVIYGLGMIVNIVLNIWLIPQFGYMAAAWTTVVSEGIVLLLSGYALSKSIEDTSRPISKY